MLFIIVKENNLEKYYTHKYKIIFEKRNGVKKNRRIDLETSRILVESDRPEVIIIKNGYNANWLYPFLRNKKKIGESANC
jgi:hypothetical protein